MLRENCVPNLKVRIISKSIGQAFAYLDYRETKIRNANATFIADIEGNHFLPKDLAPLGVECNA